MVSALNAASALNLTFGAHLQIGFAIDFPQSATLIIDEAQDLRHDAFERSSDNLPVWVSQVQGNDVPETHELILSEPFLIWRSSLSSSPGTAI